ncbi:MAG TPA: hypothetical protein DCZ95_11705 [Verrucomicrobia bacterium]|nr:hypothetical protein [Verrucomicrobiota bacterium]
MIRGLVLWIAFLCPLALAGSLTIDTPQGPVTIEVPHVGPQGNLVRPGAPQPAGFTPPSIFSAPLPSGSGARALGTAGAFTALADDATAASWNPGGLTQLETPEFSYVLRGSRESQQHRSSSSSFQTDGDEFDALHLNYMSIAYPFRWLQRNWVASFNYQESYDFTQQFTAQKLDSSGSSDSGAQAGRYTDTVVDRYSDPHVELTITEHLTTDVDSTIRQMLSQNMISSLDFEQQGVIEAFSPAFAVDLNKRLAAGMALNFYQDGKTFGNAIRSSIQADYSGYSDSTALIDTTRRTSGYYTYDGVAHFEPSGDIPFPYDVPFNGDGTVEPFTDQTDSTSRNRHYVEGHYNEQNEFDDLTGFNATFGILWAVNTHINLGLTVDLPWTAEASMTKTVNNTQTTYDSSRSRVVDVSETHTVQNKDVEFTFPAYAAAGITLKWNNRTYSMFEVSQTRWSDFSFQADGEEKINPLNGQPADASPIDDCWAARVGTEHLLIFPSTIIPLRAGFAWEEHPAVDSPDNYWSVSLGSGVSIGKAPVKCTIDVAYSYTWANDVLSSLVPGQSGLASDVEKHQIFVSNIWHF